MNPGSESGAAELRREHLAALDALRHAKNMAFWLAVMAIVVHLATWYAVRHTALLDARSADGATTATAGSTAGAGAAAAARMWELRLSSALDVAGFVGRASIVLALGLYILSLLVSLSARLGGAAGMARACVWALLALALLVPWDRMTPDEVSNLPSAFYGMEDVVRAGLDGSAAGGALLHAWSAADVIRFAAYPLVILALVVVAQLAYRSGYQRAAGSPAVRLPMREV